MKKLIPGAIWMIRASSHAGSYAFYGNPNAVGLFTGPYTWGIHPDGYRPKDEGRLAKHEAGHTIWTTKLD